MSNNVATREQHKTSVTVVRGKPALDGARGAGLTSGDIPAPASNSVAPQRITTSSTVVVMTSVPSQPDADGTPSKAPEIPEPTFSGAPDELALMLSSVMAKTSDTMVRSAATDATIQAKQRNAEMAKREKAIAEMHRKMAEAEKQANNPVLKALNKVFGGIGYAVGMALLGVATVVTAGAASPLLAAAAYGSGKQMAEGNFDFSLTKAMQTGVSDILVNACGVSQAQAQQISQVAVGVAIAMTVMGVVAAPDSIGDAAGGTASLAGADEKVVVGLKTAVNLAVTIGVAIAMTVASGGAGGTAALSQVGVQLQRLAEIVKGVYGATQGALSVANGAVGISVAKNKYDAALLDAQTKDLQALLAQMQQQDENTKEVIETFLGYGNSSFEDMSDIIKAVGDSQSRMNAQIV
ncbi:hypothetical protein PIN31115_04520 [Pandoraea iniqua]|uniref:Translocator protein BipB-like C-terminal domain-containing protein n=1 Tax=Pandoraea iniqua TaxID=2508288 RepID=A0A5E4YKA8_9BURK|nr:type III secretion system translocon subunit SctE [Pandoraea iniqua]VVE48413.1 hypothetical protein PIN31115_04520 [Pandoraea iniqua]